MILLYYDKNCDKNTLKSYLQTLSKSLKGVSKDSFLFVPKDFDVLLDCSIEQLEEAKSVIEKAISLKANKQ